MQSWPSRRSDDGQPLLGRLWSAAASWISPAYEIGLADLPALQARSPEYWSQPCAAVCTILVVSYILVFGTQSLISAPCGFDANSRLVVSSLMWTWAIIAAMSTLYIIVGRAGEIHRSHETSLPIPDAVAKQIRAAGSLEQMSNLPGPDDSRTHGTYCVRCLVWRPPAVDPVTKVRQKSHHCRICQRCFVGFDHHCDFFGRCIVQANMPCFMITISMLWVALLTSGIALLVVMASWQPPEDYVAATSTNTSASSLLT